MEIQLECWATVANARENTRYCPVGAAADCGRPLCVPHIEGVDRPLDTVPRPRLPLRSPFRVRLSEFAFDSKFRLFAYPKKFEGST